MPCLVIHGDRDVEPTTLERCGRPTAAGIVGAQLVVYEGAPHGLFVSHRARLNEDLLRFVASS
jgi:pimeloyl-ACP methyl ester carboxylesterase